MDEVFENDLSEDLLSQDDLAASKAEIAQAIPYKVSREIALNPIKNLDPEILDLEASARLDRSAYETALAEQLKNLACSGGEDAAVIARGLIGKDPDFGLSSRLGKRDAQAPSLLEAILSKYSPVSAALTNAVQAALKEITKDAAASRP